LFINARHGGALQTMFRDETTGPLDPDNALRYVEMLRRVQQIGGFAHTLFVSHNPAAAALADVQVRVADGRLTVHHAPFSEAA
jgi:exonuclease SbcC